METSKTGCLVTWLKISHSLWIIIYSRHVKVCVTQRHILSACAFDYVLSRYMHLLFLYPNFQDRLASLYGFVFYISKNGFTCDMGHMSRVVRKPAFCICENKDADQLRGNREADQRLCFRHMDSAIPLLSRSEISSL